MKQQDLPHPDADWSAFSAAVSSLNDKEPMVWSSATMAPAKWINMSILSATYGPNKRLKNNEKNGGTDIGDACCTVA